MALRADSQMSKRLKGPLFTVDLKTDKNICHHLVGALASQAQLETFQGGLVNDDLRQSVP